MYLCKKRILHKSPMKHNSWTLWNFPQVSLPLFCTSAAVLRTQLLYHAYKLKCHHNGKPLELNMRISTITPHVLHILAVFLYCNSPFGFNPKKKIKKIATYTVQTLRNKRTSKRLMAQISNSAACWSFLARLSLQPSTLLTCPAPTLSLEKDS